MSDFVVRPVSYYESCEAAMFDGVQTRDVGTFGRY